MTIRLEGGYEKIEFWRQVQSVGDDILRNYGFSDWTVTLRPKTAAEIETGTDEPGEDDAVVRIDATAQQLMIAGLNEGDFNSPQEVIEIPIVNWIGDAMGDWYDEDEQGGEG